MYIAMKANISSLLPQLIKTTHTAKGKKGEDRVEHYMSQLSTEHRRKLYNLYKLDFELFGYDPGEALCKDEVCT